MVLDDQNALDRADCTRAPSAMDGITGRERDVAKRAVAAADAAVLRMALIDETGDPSLIAMKIVRKPVRGGSMEVTTLGSTDDAVVRARALDYLAECPPVIPIDPPLMPESLLALAGDERLTPAGRRLAVEELDSAADGRAVRWRGRPNDAVLADATVAVVGAGISGLSAALRLRELGLPVVVLEKRDEVGGTWLWNDYPGARVDVTTHVYQFKAQAPHAWRRALATQPEILASLKELVDRHELRRDIRFGTELLEARWDEPVAKWELTVRGGGGEHRISVRFLISATGLFTTARLPAIPGIERFAGPTMHTTAWDGSVNLSGKRVGLIGTGSSGAQLLPHLVRTAGSLTVFQRTPNWVMPLPSFDAEHPPEQAWLTARLPSYLKWLRHAALVLDRQIEPLQEYDPAWRAGGGAVNRRNDALRAYLDRHVRERFAGRPELIAASLPSYPPAARRMVVDNGWYDALLSPHVSLVTDPIVRVDGSEVVSAAGRHRLDALVLGSGFDVERYLFPVSYRGVGGQSPADLWEADGARAYLGLTMPGFPNLFVFYGPNGQPRSGGFHAWADMWSRYAALLIVETLERGATTAEVRRTAFDDYNQRLDEAMATLVWGADGAGSYYLNRHGRSAVNMPWRADNYFEMIERPNMTEYDIR